MTKCTPEESAAMAEKIFKPDCFNAEEIARLIDLAREPLQAELYRVTAGWREAFDLGIAHQDRVKALEQERDALKAELRGIDLQLNDSRLNNTMTAREAIAELQRERDALAAQVAKIRAEAMEEAAALCESKIERPAGFGGRFEGYGSFMDSLSGNECAALIRARIPG